MHRRPFLKALEQYEQTWALGAAPYRSFDRKLENEHLTEIRNFVLQTTDCFHRSSAEGHVTGSALVTTPQWDRVLLTHHRKLGKWLQLGGHCDGDPLVQQTALREAQEESGLQMLSFAPIEFFFGPGAIPPLLFDLDCHIIPERKNEAAHVHYDARYLIVAKHPQLIHVSEESNELKWFSLADAFASTDEQSMHRQFDKLDFLRTRLVSEILPFGS